MKSRRLFAVLCGGCLVLATPGALCAQGGGGGGSSAGGGGGSSIGGGGQGGGGQSIGNTSIGTGNNNTTRGITQVAIQTVTSGTGSATTNPSNVNPFVSTYAEPTSWGLPKNYQSTFGPLAKPTVTFAKGLYTSTSTSSATTSASTAAQANGFTTTGMVRNPQYMTVLSSKMPTVVHQTGELFSEVRSAIDRSSYLTDNYTRTNKANIQVAVKDGIVLLTGPVESADAARLVESLVRTTPGVRDVQNNLSFADVK